MRIFVTGATGFIGSAVVQELIGAGHSFLGLARSETSASALLAAGAAVHRGELSDLDSLSAGARSCDGVIHLAFIHDFSQYAANAETDRLATAAMAAALQGANKPLVVTSGTAVLPPGRIGVETDAATSHIRSASELVLKAADTGVRVSAVRLAPSVHGAGDRAFVPALIDVARRTEVSAYIGDGENRWPAVHRLDAAVLFRLTLEKAAPGSCLHGVAEEGIPVRAIAETIGEGLGLPVRSITSDEAAAQFGWLAEFLAMDAPASSALTRAKLGWTPEQPYLLTSMRLYDYFA
jgi:nucleoside-diphosphate-sugar epimerase